MAARVVEMSWRRGEDEVNVGGRFSGNYAGCAGDILAFWGLEGREI